MPAFILRRVLASVPVMVAVALIVFLMLRLTPGDPALLLAGDAAPPERIAAIRADLGLDQPIHVQLLAWFGRLAVGDLGVSIFSRVPVTALIAQRLEPTLMLALVTILLSVLVAVPLGVLAAAKAGTLTDRLVMLLAVVGFSMPVFVLGALLIWWFGLNLRWLPTQGYRSPFADPTGFVRHMTLPALTLSAVYVALITRTTRAAMLETLGEDYIRTARAKGQHERRILFRHALRNAAAPVVTVIGLGLTLLLGGAVVTETVFNIPGLGRLIVDAVLKRDYPIVQGLILFFSFLFILVNLFIDLAYTALDPRIRR